MSHPVDFDEIIELEKKLLDPAFRKTSVELHKLISDDFLEFGTSGKIYDKKAILKLLSSETPTDVEGFDFDPIQLSTDVVQLRFKTRRRNPDGTLSGSIRSSIWKRFGQEWRMVFHQGTKTNI